MRMGILSEYTGKEMLYYHPTFLYESLWNILGFVIITMLYKKKKFNGQNALMYLCWYGFGRMFIEGLRTDSLYVGPFRISQLVGGICFVVAGGLLLAGLILKHKGRLDGVMGGLLVAPAAPVLADGEKETTDADTDSAGDADEAAETLDILTPEENTSTEDDTVEKVQESEEN